MCNNGNPLRPVADTLHMENGLYDPDAKIQNTSRGKVSVWAPDYNARYWRFNANHTVSGETVADSCTRHAIPSTGRTSSLELQLKNAKYCRNCTYHLRYQSRRPKPTNDNGVRAVVVYCFLRLSTQHRWLTTRRRSILILPRPLQKNPSFWLKW